MKKVTSVCRAQLLSIVDESLFIKNIVEALFLISYIYLIYILINSSGQIISESFLNVNLFIGLFGLGVYSFFSEALYASYKDFLDKILVQVIGALLSALLYFLFPVLPF